MDNQEQIESSAQPAQSAHQKEGFFDKVKGFFGGSKQATAAEVTHLQQVMDEQNQAEVNHTGSNSPQVVDGDFSKNTDSYPSKFSGGNQGQITGGSPITDEQKAA
ncbi:hypothetical protein M1563_00370 [Patescibacteria group bacterium]|nr:hypothetical protein [Patescibacteria group bacterium]MCL5409988.1 hypothetical protein [Patescibacteria group bacterium]